MNFKDRLKMFIGYLDIPVSHFEKKCNLSNAYIANLGDGIKVETLQKIKEAYPMLNENWLFEGKGEMLLEKKGDVGFMPEENLMTEIFRLRGQVELLEKLLKECRREYKEMLLFKQ